MSTLVLHMDKFKKDAIRGIQSHNRRERESHSNPDIDYSRSAGNYDLCKSDHCISTSWNANRPNNSSGSGRKKNSGSENARRWKPLNRSSVNNPSSKIRKPCRNAVVQGCAKDVLTIHRESRLEGES